MVSYPRGGIGYFALQRKFLYGLRAPEDIVGIT
jgi:hypothetical protein